MPAWAAGFPLRPARPPAPLLLSERVLPLLPPLPPLLPPLPLRAQQQTKRPVQQTNATPQAISSGSHRWPACMSHVISSVFHACSACCFPCVCRVDRRALASRLASLFAVLSSGCLAAALPLPPPALRCAASRVPPPRPVPSRRSPRLSVLALPTAASPPPWWPSSSCCRRNRACARR
jgi:hypothetical protein